MRSSDGCTTDPRGTHAVMLCQSSHWESMSQAVSSNGVSLWLPDFSRGEKRALSLRDIKHGFDIALAEHYVRASINGFARGTYMGVYFLSFQETRTSDGSGSSSLSRPRHSSSGPFLGTDRSRAFGAMHTVTVIIMRHKRVQVITCAYQTQQKRQHSPHAEWIQPC